MKRVLDKRDLRVVRRLSWRGHASPAGLMAGNVRHGRPTGRGDVLDLLTARQEGSFTQEATLRVDTLCSPLAEASRPDVGPFPASQTIFRVRGLARRARIFVRSVRATCAVAVSHLATAWTRSILLGVDEWRLPNLISVASKAHGPVSPHALRGTLRDQRISRQERRLRRGHRYLYVRMLRPDRSGACGAQAREPQRKMEVRYRRGGMNHSVRGCAGYMPA